MRCRGSLSTLTASLGFLSKYGEHREDFEMLEAVPTHRSERWAVINGKDRGLLPDASFIARIDGMVLPFVVEFERRAAKPALIVERLAPYKNYYDSMFNYEDLGVMLVALVVFESKVMAAGLCLVLLQR